MSSPPTSTTDSASADLFAKRYAILGVIGTGAMGIVHRAYDTELRRAVAIKRLIDEGTRTPTPRRTRLLREARAIAQINHPNVIAVYDVGEHEGTDFVVMELVEGGSLRQRIREGPAWTIDEALDWLVDVGAALAHAHDAGLVHRDVKPSNLLLTRERRLKVADFGVVKEIDQATGPTTQLHSARAPITRVGQIVGTPRYMAPEQLRAENVDGRCDQYAWGLVAYELLGEQHPYGPAVDDDTLQQVVDGLFLPRSLRIDTPALPVAIEAIVLRTLRAERGDRFASMRDVLDALAEARRGLTLETRVRARLDAGGTGDRLAEGKAPAAEAAAAPRPAADATALTATVDDPPDATATVPQRASGTAPLPPELRARASGAGAPAASAPVAHASSPGAALPRAIRAPTAPPSSRAGRLPRSVVAIVSIGAGALAIAAIAIAVAAFALGAKRSSSRLARAREGAKVVCTSSCGRVVVVNGGTTQEVDVDVDGTMTALHVRSWPTVDVRPIDVTPGSRSITVSDSASGSLVTWLDVTVEQGGTVVYVVDRPPNVCFSVVRAGAAPIPMPTTSATWSPPTRIDDWLPPGGPAGSRTSFVGGACP